MRSLSFCFFLTLSAFAAACGEGGPSLDAAPTADGPVAFDGSSPIADAAPADAAPPDSGFEIGVRCGEGQDLCAPPGAAGCCETKGGSSCLPVGKSFCAGRLTSCDGPEDCGGGESCCSEDGDPPSCEQAGLCNPQEGDAVQCHVDADCPDPLLSVCCLGSCQGGCE
jgi:hypothetical protein